MNRKLQLLIALAISTLFVVAPDVAATNQGLSWGVSVRDAFNYQLSVVVTGGNLDMNEAFFMNVTGTDPLPNSITNWAQITSAGVGLWWVNGTSLGIYELLFIGLVSLGTSFVVPIGNWTLLEQVIETYAIWDTSTTFANSSLYWGLKLSTSSGGMTDVVQASYLKSDGALARYSFDATNETTHMQQGSISVVRANLPTDEPDILGFTQQYGLYIAASVIVLVGGLVCMRKE